MSIRFGTANSHNQPYSPSRLQAPCLDLPLGKNTCNPLSYLSLDFKPKFLDVAILLIHNYCRGFQAKVADII